MGVWMNRSLIGDSLNAREMTASLAEFLCITHRPLGCILPSITHNSLAEFFKHPPRQARCSVSDSHSRPIWRRIIECIVIVYLLGVAIALAVECIRQAEPNGFWEWLWAKGGTQFGRALIWPYSLLQSLF